MHFQGTQHSARCCFLLAAFVALFCQTIQADDNSVLVLKTLAESQIHFQKHVQPIVQKSCVGCHDESNNKGDLNLAELAIDMSGNSAARWSMVVEKVTSREMPPKKQSPLKAEDIQTIVQWANAEAKRSGKHFKRRESYENGNAVPHHLLFDPKNIPPYDGGPRIRQLSPDLYSNFLNDLVKNQTGIGQPFSAESGTTFRDMGDALINEPTTTQLIENALQIVNHQTAHKIVDGKIQKIGQVAKELIALFDPMIETTDASLSQGIHYQFRTILKREPTNEEAKRYLQLMQNMIKESGRTLGVRYALAAVLLHPESVFRLENGAGKPDAKGRVRLSPRQIAFALAYALSERRPDGALLLALAKGELETDAGVAKQIERMLADPKLKKEHVLRFFQEYFDYVKANDVFKEQKDFNGHEPPTLVEDTNELIRWILEKDRNVLAELLTTPYSFVSYRNAADSRKKRADALAKFNADKAKNPEKFKDKVPRLPGRSVYESYNLDEFPVEQPVLLPKEQRSGILTQPSWLIANSTTFDNHAIHRGKWIRERLLGDVVPDIPITVDAQLPDAPDQTLRERMKVTQADYCWKCHQLMNDLAYPFEQFDHFGRYRTSERTLDLVATEKNVDKKGNPRGPVYRQSPLNTDGLVAHTQVPALHGIVKNPREMLEKLAQSEHVEQVFVRHAFRFWLGRNESLGDAGSLQAVHRAYRQNQGSMKQLIIALLSSESFLYRVPEPHRSSE